MKGTIVLSKMFNTVVLFLKLAMGIAKVFQVTVEELFEFTED